MLSEYATFGASTMQLWLIRTGKKEVTGVGKINYYLSPFITSGKNS